MKRFFGYLALHEKILWLTSLAVIIIFFFVFDGSSWLSFSASLIGVTSLILLAKGNPAGQILMIVFCIMYTVINSWRKPTGMPVG